MRPAEAADIAVSQSYDIWYKTFYWKLRRQAASQPAMDENMPYRVTGLGSVPSPGPLQSHSAPSLQER
jgi:hypothetical protein